MATIKVTARAGRTVPIHSSIATAPGATQLYLREGDELEVEESNALVQRALRPGGDLVRVVEPKVGKTAELDGGGPPAVFGDASPASDEPKVAEPLPAPVEPAPLPPAPSKES